MLWVLRPKRYSTINKNIADSMAELSTIPKEWIQPVLDAQTKTFKEMLLNGHNINLPGVGTFALRLKTVSHEKREDISLPDDIVRKKILFTPCKELKDAMENIVFEIDSYQDSEGNILVKKL